VKREKTFQGQEILEKSRSGRKFRYAANQLVLQLKPQFSADKQTRISVLNVLPPESSLQGEFDQTGMAVVNLPPTADPFEIAQKLSDHDAVEFAEPTLLESGSTATGNEKIK
jgi:hypothetical protein